MIYLIDTIGKEVGMHLYNDAFVKEFNEKGLHVKVVSNYQDSNTLNIIPNFYKGGVLRKIIMLIITFLRLSIFRVRKRKNVFAYQIYGMRNIDMLFTLLFYRSKSFFIIVHDVFAFTPEDKKDRCERIKKFVYRNMVLNVICHSARTKEDLKSIGFDGNVVEFPHFSYSFSKEINNSELGTDVINSIIKEKVNILFFGQISFTKGIDLLVDALDLINEDVQDEINIVIAGMDKANLVSSRLFPSYVQRICRYITDSELNYLFSRSDFILLPYKKIYQSGVLDAAIYFKTPVLLSDVEYFTQFIKEYPSFGELISPCDPQQIAKMIGRVSNIENTKRYYNRNDIFNYIEAHDSSRLIKTIEGILKMESLDKNLWN